MKIKDLSPGDLFKVKINGEAIELQLMECMIFKGEYSFARRTPIGIHKLFVLFPDDDVELVQRWKSIEEG